MIDLRILLNINISQAVYRYLPILAGLSNLNGLRRKNIFRKPSAVKSNFIIYDREAEAGGIDADTGRHLAGENFTFAGILVPIWRSAHAIPRIKEHSVTVGTELNDNKGIPANSLCLGHFEVHGKA